VSKRLAENVTRFWERKFKIWLMLGNINLYLVLFFIISSKVQGWHIFRSKPSFKKLWKMQPKQDYRSLIHILQYLKGTINKSISYNKRNRFIGYSDLDFCKWWKKKKQEDSLAVLFSYLVIGDSPISWKSQQQKKV